MTTTSATGNNRRRGAPAFTLIELSIVVFIIAVLMAVSVPNFVRTYNGAVLNETVRTFATTCQLARIQAVTQQQNAVMHLNVERQVFWVSQTVSNAENAGAEQTLKSVELSRRVALVSAERADATAGEDKQTDISFYPNGTCDAATVVFRGTEKGAGLAVGLDPITARATAYPIKL